MDKSKINQTELDFSLEIGTTKLNLYTGRILCECPGLTIGANSFKIATSLIYNSHYKETDFGNRKIGFGNGWKLNIEQYVFPYLSTYNIDGFNEDDYVYIDASWSIHRFVKYKDSNVYSDLRNVYYDASGSGLRLVTGKNRYSQIFDGNNSIIEFDEKGRISYIISSINSNIVKEIKYNNDNLISICDQRKPNRKINFWYNDSKTLKQMSINNYDISIYYNYDSTNLLNKMVKVASSKEKDMMYFTYDENKILNYMINAESLRAICFKNDLLYEPKVIEIKEGAMKKQIITEDVSSELFVGDDAYLGEGYYLVGSGKKAKDYRLEMIDNYVKNKTTFNYSINYTDVINDKNIKTRYYFNINGFTTSTLEVGENDNSLKTLFKTGGWQLSQNGSSSYKINGQSATQLTIPHQYITKNLSSFLNIFENYNNGEKKKNEYTENFVISFWLKTSNDITNDAYAKVYITKSKIQTLYGKTTLDKVKGNSWQYITIPVFLGENQESISEIKIDFTGLQTSQILYLSDLRIAIGNNTLTKFFDLNHSIELKDMTRVVYIKNGLEYSEPISSDFFLTDSDLFATYKSLYYKKQKGQNDFDLVCCGCTKVISVSDVKIFDDNNNITLTVDDDGIPNYYTYSSNRIGKKQWSITETQNRFHKELENKYYYETKVSIQIMDKDKERVDKNKSATTYEWKYANGTIKAKKDEYSIVAKYSYDSYGNITLISTYNDDEVNKEYLNTEYNYDVDEKYRENPVSCIENGVKKEFSYNEPNFTTQYTIDGNSKIDYEYDSFDEKVTQISNVNKVDGEEEYRNSIVYDEYGRVKSVSDLSNRTYGFIYNAFGDALKYFENGRLILEKSIEKGSSYDLLRDKTYNNEQVINNKVVYTPYENITKMDKYGKIISQTNKRNNNDEGTTINFTYQNINESESVAKVLKINDPYEKVNYNYIYDDDNRPSGYRVYNNSGEKENQVRQIGVGDTEYYFKLENEYIMSRVIKEDSEYDKGEVAKFTSPRIRRTQYMKMKGENSDKFEENYKEFNFEYKYDKLGRLSKKSNEKIEHSGPYVNNDVNLEQNITYEKSKTTIKEIKYTVNSQDFNSQDSASFSFENKYDNKNNITEMKLSGKRFIVNPSTEAYTDTTDFETRVHNYTYDAFDKLIKETRKDNDITNLDIEYQYYKKSGNINKVIKNKNTYKKFNYQNGRKTNISLLGTDYSIDYDNYGNIIKDTQGIIKYNSRNYLESYYIGLNEENNLNTNFIKKCQYLYNYQGVRYKKIIETPTNTKYVHYYLDGSRILGEDWSYSDETIDKSIRYFYDADGIAGLRYDGRNFNFVKDSLGNVSKLMYRGKVIGEYIYDAWGNSEEVELSIDNDETNGARDRFVFHNNPFRWKSHYLDLETGLYFVNGRFYSPILMEYLNADNVENISSNEVNSLDRHAITLNNSITYEVNTSTIFTDNELYPDPTYDPLKDKSWWDLNWKKAVQWIAFTVVFIVSVVLICIPATSAFGIGMFMAGMKAAISGAIVGGLIGGIMNAIHGNSFMEGLVEGAVYGFINGFTSGAIMFCISQAISAIVNASSSRCTSPGNCFIVGTIVLTQFGNKNIEDIEVGDEVLSYDEETGNKTFKKVVQLFRKTTDKWIHLLFKNNETELIEELVCTPNHPFYVDNLGWVEANNLLENDEVLLYNNVKSTLLNKEVELLDEPETTYNFEVEDYHTYYVGISGILVHNDCANSQPDHSWTTERKRYWKSQGESYKNNAHKQMSLSGKYKVSNENVGRMLKGLAPEGIDGYSVQLHHVVGKSNDFYNYVEITRVDHYSNFKSLHPWLF